MVKLSRDISFVKYFESNQCEIVSIKLSKLWIISFEQDKMIELKLSEVESRVFTGLQSQREKHDENEYSPELLAVTLIGSICSLSIED